jgi:hypothetical protein
MLDPVSYGLDAPSDNAPMDIDMNLFLQSL